MNEILSQFAQECKDQITKDPIKTIELFFEWAKGREIFYHKNFCIRETSEDSWTDAVVYTLIPNHPDYLEADLDLIERDDRKCRLLEDSMVKYYFCDQQDIHTIIQNLDKIKELQSMINAIAHNLNRCINMQLQFLDRFRGQCFVDEKGFVNQITNQGKITPIGPLA